MHGAERSRHAGTLVAPPLAQMGILSLCVSRAVVGLGEGFAPSAVTHVMANLVPASERSRAVAYVFGGLDLGSVIGLLLCGPLIATYGWPSVFYVFGIIGLAWAVAWPLSKPSQKDAVVIKEQELNEAIDDAQRRQDALDSGDEYVAKQDDDPVRPTPHTCHCGHCRPLWPPKFTCRCHTASFCAIRQCGR
jgi:Major Facilitator Superfamily